MLAMRTEDSCIVFECLPVFVQHEPRSFVIYYFHYVPCSGMRRSADPHKSRVHNQNELHSEENALEAFDRVQVAQIKGQSKPRVHDRGTLALVGHNYSAHLEFFMILLLNELHQIA